MTGRKRTARAAVVLAAELQAALAEAGVCVPAEQIADAVVPVAVIVAEAEAVAEKAARSSARTRKLAGQLLGKTADRLAAPAPRVLAEFDPAEWTMSRTAADGAVTAPGGLS